MTTWQMDRVEPRSTSSHCGSEYALDHRVDKFPSVALDGGGGGPSSADAVVGGCRAIFVLPHLPPVPEGSVQIWCAEPVQVSMSSREPVLPPGSVRHRWACEFTSSPFDSWVHFCATVPLHGYQSTSVPLLVPAPTKYRHPPSVRSVLSV